MFRRDQEGTYPTSPLNTAPLSLTEFEDVDAPTEATSCYTVRAVVFLDPLVESADSQEICVRLEDLAAPPTPTGMAAFVRDQAVEIVWDAVAVPDLAGYRVMRAAQGGKPALLHETDAATTKFTDQTAKPGVVYQYTVVAFDKAGNESAPTASAQAGTQQ